jgi:hypothetical protein
MPQTYLQLDSREDIDRLCCQFFDDWCERRGVLPLAYLMHAWPMPDKCDKTIDRLLRTLKELRQYHPEFLTLPESTAIERLLLLFEYQPDEADTLPSMQAVELL